MDVQNLLLLNYFIGYLVNRHCFLTLRQLLSGEKVQLLFFVPTVDGQKGVLVPLSHPEQEEMDVLSGYMLGRGLDLQ